MMKLQLDANDNDGKALKRAIGMLVILVVAATAGLVAAEVRGKPRPKVLRTDANWHRAAAAAQDAPFWAADADDIDEALSRPDKGTDQHG